MVSVGTTSATQIVSRETVEAVDLDDELNLYIDVTGADIMLLEGSRREVLDGNTALGIPLNNGDTFPVSTAHGEAIYAIGDGGTATVESVVSKIRIGEVSR